MQYSHVFTAGGATQSAVSLGATMIDSNGVLAFADRNYNISYSPTGNQRALTFTAANVASPAVNHLWLGLGGAFSNNDNTMMLCDAGMPTTPTPTSHSFLPASYRELTFDEMTTSRRTATYFYKIRNCAQVQNNNATLETTQGWLDPSGGSFGENLTGSNGAPDVREMMSADGLLKFNSRSYLRVFAKAVNGTDYYLIAFWRDYIDGSATDNFVLGYQSLPQ